MGSEGLGGSYPRPTRCRAGKGLKPYGLNALVERGALVGAAAYFRALALSPIYFAVKCAILEGIAGVIAVSALCAVCRPSSDYTTTAK